MKHGAGVATQAFRQSVDDRAEPRDEVYHRTRLTLVDRRAVTATVVNLSPHGLMLRVEAEVAVGDIVNVALPVVGIVRATVRWALGGRIGCQLERVIAPRDYGALLAATGA